MPLSQAHLLHIWRLYFANRRIQVLGLAAFQDRHHGKNLLRGLGSVHDRHFNVHQDHIWDELAGERNGPLTVFCLPDNFHVELVVDKSTPALHLSSQFSNSDVPAHSLVAPVAVITAITLVNHDGLATP